ncbi:MAG TPA: alpha/beta hydrolase [Solirubrobacteraceae bacterium]|nr:alpha/beta hydrolase [Solirubrobacteraceae bacterium]
MPAVDTVPPEETRRARREGRGIFPAPVFLPEAQTREIDGPAGAIRLRVFIPPKGGVQGAFLHLHGGGWTLGDNDMQDPRLMHLAAETGLAVVSVGYRLAPEHPYPAGPDDCEAAALWLLSAEGRELAGDGPLAIGGDSAGAHLAVLTLLRLRDRHLISGGFAAAVLQYGAYDLSMTPSQRLWGERNLVLSGSILRWFADQFLPGYDREQRRDPDISPLFADLREMPPAIFTIGTEDALLDDTLFMEARWRMAGAPTEIQVWQEAPHGFIGLPMSITEPALSAEHEFLRRTLGLQR